MSDERQGALISTNLPATAGEPGAGAMSAAPGPGPTALAVKGVDRLNTANTPTNALAFLVEQMIRQNVNTAEVVSIDQAEAQGQTSAGGRATATPLISQTDGWNQALPAAPLPNLPFYRPQAGRAAIIMEPQPGDKALAIFTKRDSSALAAGKNEASPPASHRTFDQADGFLLNGFLGLPPEIWLWLNPATGEISLSTKAASIDISCRESGDIDIKTGAGKVNITATDTVTVKAPQIVMGGNVRITGNLTTEGVSEGPGGGAFNTRGGLHNEGGEIRSNNITLETHTHSGVQPGDGGTAGPNAGS